MMANLRPVILLQFIFFGLASGAFAQSEFDAWSKANCDCQRQLSKVMTYIENGTTSDYWVSFQNTTAVELQQVYVNLESLETDLVSERIQRWDAQPTGPSQKERQPCTRSIEVPLSSKRPLSVEAQIKQAEAIEFYETDLPEMRRQGLSFVEWADKLTMQCRALLE